MLERSDAIVQRLNGNLVLVILSCIKRPKMSLIWMSTMPHVGQSQRKENQLNNQKI